jgi:CBS domain containing-hemolysin-like protein/mannitol/fructose-specific phosphotransferase system IIA component (Ntr-type)
MCLAEFSLIRVRKTRLKELTEEGSSRARLALYAEEHIDDYLSSIQLAITMTSLALGWVGNPSVGSLLRMLLPNIFPMIPQALQNAISFAIAFLTITSLHVVFGEQVPKLIAIKFPDKILTLVIYPLQWFYKATYLFKNILMWAAYAVLKLIGVNPKEKEKTPSEEEIRMIFDESQDSGQFSLSRSLMFENLFDFKGETAKKIMTPRANIVALKEDSSWAEKFAVIKNKKFSRYPVFTNTIDDAAQYVMVKEISLDFLTENAAPPIEKYMRPLLVLKEDTPVEVALREFQNRRIHQGLIKNKENIVTGLLTLEDVLEELVGEIRDENETTPSFTLSNVLLPDACVFNLETADKFEAYNILTDRLHAVHTYFSKEHVKDLISSRERLLSFYIGKGVAIPHARLTSITTPVISFGLSKKGIIFNQDDKHPAKFFFLILSPAKDHGAQLKLLAQISSFVSNKTVLSRLLKAKSGRDVAEIMIAFEHTIAL